MVAPVPLQVRKPALQEIAIGTLKEYIDSLVAILLPCYGRRCRRNLSVGRLAMVGPGESSVIAKAAFAETGWERPYQRGLD